MCTGRTRPHRPADRRSDNVPAARWLEHIGRPRHAPGRRGTTPPAATGPPFSSARPLRIASASVGRPARGRPGPARTGPRRRPRGNRRPRPVLHGRRRFEQRFQEAGRAVVSGHRIGPGLDQPDVGPQRTPGKTVGKLAGQLPGRRRVAPIHRRLRRPLEGIVGPGVPRGPTRRRAGTSPRPRAGPSVSAGPRRCGIARRRSTERRLLARRPSRGSPRRLRAVPLQLDRRQLQRRVDREGFRRVGDQRPEQRLGFHNPRDPAGEGLGAAARLIFRPALAGAARSKAQTSPPGPRRTARTRAGSSRLGPSAVNPLGSPLPWRGRGGRGSTRRGPRVRRASGRGHIGPIRHPTPRERRQGRS